MTMVVIKVPEETARNLLEYINEYIDHVSSPRYINEAIKDKIRIKKAMDRSAGRTHKFLTEFRL